MNQEEVESQLSAMYDGELPAAECELLSRRVDRDEELRGRWSRYAVIGAVMRSEPVAAVRGDFSQRISAALSQEANSGAASRPSPGGASRPSRRKYWTAFLAASLVAVVAGGSILMLRDISEISTPQLASTRAAMAVPVAGAAAISPAVVAAAAAAVTASRAGASSGEPLSYVTPSVSSRPDFGLRTQLANYVVAHSEYSMPLMRRNLLSALVTAEDAGDGAAAGGAAGTSGNYGAEVPRGARNAQPSNAAAIAAPHGNP